MERLSAPGLVKMRLLRVPSFKTPRHSRNAVNVSGSGGLPCLQSGALQVRALEGLKAWRDENGFSEVTLRVVVLLVPGDLSALTPLVLAMVLVLLLLLVFRCWCWGWGQCWCWQAHPVTMSCLRLDLRRPVLQAGMELGPCSCQRSAPGRQKQERTLLV